LGADAAMRTRMSWPSSISSAGAPATVRAMALAAGDDLKGFRDHALLLFGFALQHHRR
jgi:hypothetical protein